MTLGRSGTDISAEDALTIPPPDDAAVELGPAADHMPPCDRSQPLSHLRAMMRSGARNVWNDYRNFYTVPSLGKLLLGVGLGAVAANTAIDAEFRDWYQDDVRGVGTNHLADFWRPIGDGWYAIPVMAGTALIGRWFGDCPSTGVLGEFGARASRAYLVGAPPLLLMQKMLSGGRPIYDQSSEWEFFGGTAFAVSGHSFMGAVPFLTGANMTENPWAKAALFACSVMPAWSRVNDDRHYLSQAALGWWLAYLATSAVDETSQAQRQFAVTPIITPEITGVGFIYQR
jgi:membrane-associated phospholipid phosphatase